MLALLCLVLTSMCATVLLLFITTARQNEGTKVSLSTQFVTSGCDRSRVLFLEACTHLKLTPWTHNLTFLTSLTDVQQGLAVHKWHFAVADNRWHQILGVALLGVVQHVSSVPKVDWQTQRGAPCEEACQLIVLERGGRGFMLEAILADCVFFFSFLTITPLFLCLSFPLLLLFVIIRYHSVFFFFIFSFQSSALVVFNHLLLTNFVHYSDFGYLILNFGGKCLMIIRLEILFLITWIAF